MALSKLSFDFQGNLNIGTSGGTATRQSKIFFNSASSPTPNVAEIFSDVFGNLNLYGSGSTVLISPNNTTSITIGNAANTFHINSIFNGTLAQGTASTALDLIGNAAATGGVADYS